MAEAFIDLAEVTPRYATITFGAGTQVFIVDRHLVATNFSVRTMSARNHAIVFAMGINNDINQIRIFTATPRDRTFNILFLDWCAQPRGRAIIGYLSYGPMDGGLETSDYRLSLARGRLPEVMGPDTVLMIGLRFAGIDMPIRFVTQFYRGVIDVEGRDEITAVQTDRNWSRFTALPSRSLRPHARPLRSQTYRSDVLKAGRRLVDVVNDNVEYIVDENLIIPPVPERGDDPTIPAEVVPVAEVVVPSSDGHNIVDKMPPQSRTEVDPTDESIPTVDNVVDTSDRPTGFDITGPSSGTGAVRKGGKAKVLPRMTNAEVDRHIAERLAAVNTPAGVNQMVDEPREPIYAHGFFDRSQPPLLSGGMSWVDPYGVSATRFNRYAEEDRMAFPMYNRRGHREHLERELTRRETIEIADYELTKDGYKPVKRVYHLALGWVESVPGTSAALPPYELPTFGTEAIPSVVDNENINLSSSTEVGTEVMRGPRACLICDMTVDDTVDNLGHCIKFHVVNSDASKPTRKAEEKE